jgi:prophage regulatory protein
MENNNGTTRVLRMKDLPPKVGFQPSTIYELIADGKFPPPFKLIPGGRAAGWLESTIDAWLQERSAGDA